MFSIGVVAYIFDENRNILLSHRRDVDVWNLPGGGVETRELPNEAVVREVKEETGLDVVIERLVGVYGKVDKDEIVFAFVCRDVGGQLSLSDEADRHCFFALDKIPVNTPLIQTERIQDALNRTAQPIFRRQAVPSTQSITWKA